MKKKYRDITVNGKQYAWKIDFNCDGDYGKFITIWDDGKKIADKCHIDFHIENITPKFVRETIEFIERFNRFPSVDDVEVIKDYNKYVPFNELALGAKFKFNYYNIPIYVKISHDTYADWSNELIDKNWVGQGIYGFDEEIKTDDDVWLIEQ